MKFNFPSAGGGALVCIFIASLSWAHEIDIGHCDTGTFTQEVSGLKCDQMDFQHQAIF
jgi:hypothetical protein